MDHRTPYYQQFYDNFRAKRIKLEAEARRSGLLVKFPVNTSHNTTIHNSCVDGWNSVTQADVDVFIHQQTNSNNTGRLGHKVLAEIKNKLSKKRGLNGCVN